MDRSLNRFFVDTAEKEDARTSFERQSARLLRIEVNDGVWLKPGAAIAYRGDLWFERLPTLGAHSMKDAALREFNPLVRATGRGRLFCGHQGCHIHVIELAGETLTVSSVELLAFEDSLHFEPMLVKEGIGIAAGGLVAVKLTGRGCVAITAHGTPITLRVVPEDPVSTDPHATVAWSEQVTPTLKTDVSWRSLFGHGGGEPVQMLFEGSGFVIVQPFEDPRRFERPRKSVEGVLERLTKL